VAPGTAANNGVVVTEHTEHRTTTGRTSKATRRNATKRGSGSFTTRGARAKKKGKGGTGGASTPGTTVIEGYEEDKDWGGQL